MVAYLLALEGTYYFNMAMVIFIPDLTWRSGIRVVLVRSLAQNTMVQGDDTN